MMKAFSWLPTRVQRRLMTFIENNIDPCVRDSTPNMIDLRASLVRAISLQSPDRTSTSAVKTNAGIFYFIVTGNEERALDALENPAFLRRSQQLGDNKRVYELMPQYQEIVSSARDLAAWFGRGFVTLQMPPDLALFELACADALEQNGIGATRMKMIERGVIRPYATVMQEWIDGSYQQFLPALVNEHPEFHDALLRHSVRSIGRMQPLLLSLSEQHGMSNKPYDVHERLQSWLSRNGIQAAGAPLASIAGHVERFSTYYNTDYHWRNVVLRKAIPMKREDVLARLDADPEYLLRMQEAELQEDWANREPLFTYKGEDALHRLRNALGTEEEENMLSTVVRRIDLTYRSSNARIGDPIALVPAGFDLGNLLWGSAIQSSPAQEDRTIQQYGDMLAVPEQRLLLELIVRGIRLGDVRRDFEFVFPAVSRHASKLIGQHIPASEAGVASLFTTYAGTLTERVEQL